MSGSSGSVIGALENSTAPLGGDTALVLSAVGTGLYSNENLSIVIIDPFDNTCDLTLTEIPQSPNVLPTALNKLQDKYWIVRSFGNAGTFAMDMTFNLPAGYLNTTDPSLGLYRREYDVDSSSWVLTKMAGAITPTTATFFGVDTLGQFSIASNGTSALPVSLLRFSGKRIDNNTQLYWETASQLNNKGFEIERSEDGYTFAKIGYVSSIVNNTSGISQYSYVDAIPTKSSILYYRLKQLDFDEKYQYSPVITLENGNQNLSTLVYPNPTSSAVNIDIVSPISTTAVIEVYDVFGRKAVEKDITIGKGNNTIRVDEVESMDRGLYIIRIVANGFVKEFKLEKK